MKISIVIVCMNNMKNIYSCLNSIKKYTTIDYEVLLVAYKFSEVNLYILHKDFPWVIIIESNEIRGFSENNNLALKKAKGDYCFVLNDDTYFDMPVVDNMYYTLAQHPEIDILSPNLVYPDGRVQFVGRPKLNAMHFVLSTLKLWSDRKAMKCYMDKKGLYNIYNISGAAFMIKTHVFKKLGWFDEQYFFSPEDIALSTKATSEGYKICQIPEVQITHIASATSSSISAATLPASFKGHLLFYSNDSKIKYYAICIIESPIILAKFAIYKLLSFCCRDSSFSIRASSQINTLFSIWSSMTPKELFIKYYNEIINHKNA